MLPSYENKLLTPCAALRDIHGWEPTTREDEYEYEYELQMVDDREYVYYRQQVFQDILQSFTTVMRHHTQ